MVGKNRHYFSLQRRSRSLGLERRMQASLSFPKPDPQERLNGRKGLTAVTYSILRHRDDWSQLLPGRAMHRLPSSFKNKVWQWMSSRLSTLQLPIFFLPKGPTCCIFLPVVTLYPRVGTENVPDGQWLSLCTPSFSCEERNYVTFVIIFCLSLSGHPKAYHTSTQRLAEKIRWIWKSMPFFFFF